MEKTYLWILALGALGVGAYILFSQNSQAPMAAPSPGGGGSPNINYNINLQAPNFPDLSAFFKDDSSGSSGSNGSTAPKKTTTPYVTTKSAQGATIYNYPSAGIIGNAPKATPIGFNFIPLPKIGG